jgi:23S rRNA pseudouridine955/2504/2580 synthase
MNSNSVSQHIVLFEEAGQRLDNFLFRMAKGVPKTHIYRIIRSGEVRINKKRAEASQKIMEGDVLRIPPMRVSDVKKPINDFISKKMSDEVGILYEDDSILVVNKPSGIAVHGGSGVSLGLIEAMRAQRPDAKFLELVHRLDRDTSGILMLAKKRSALVHLHEQIREGKMEKRYLLVVHGALPVSDKSIPLKYPLLKYLLPNGERRVKVSADGGQASHTNIRVKGVYHDGLCSLVEAQLKTGRTHQIRVHLQTYGHPILGDDKYGDQHLDKVLRPKRLLLHAKYLAFVHPKTEEKMIFEAPLPDAFEKFISNETN